MKLWNKYTRSLVLLMLFIIIFIGASVWQKSKVAEQKLTVPVLVANEDIQPYQAITPDNTHVEERVKSDIPEDALTKPDQLQEDNSFAPVIGYMKGAIIQKEYIDTASESKKGSSVTLRKGEFQIGVTIDLTTAAGGEVRPGTHVDVVSFISNGQGRGGQTAANPALKNIVVEKVVNSEGAAVQTGDDSNSTPAVAVLRVNEQQRNLIVGYQESGKVYLSPAGEQKK